MKLTKFGHSCIRLQNDGGTLVIDPGGLSEDESVDGADAILITHEHFDHFAETRVRNAAVANPDLQVWTVAAVADRLPGLGRQLHITGNGDSFTAARFDVEAYGTWHAEVHRDVPVVPNTGFLINDSLFHPGDALTVLDKPVDTLILPVHAPWSRMSDLIDWVREVNPARTVAAHEGALNEVGVTVVAGLLGESGPGIGSTFYWLEPSGALSDV